MHIVTRVYLTEAIKPKFSVFKVLYALQGKIKMNAKENLMDVNLRFSFQVIEK